VRLVRLLPHSISFLPRLITFLPDCVSFLSHAVYLFTQEEKFLAEEKNFLVQYGRFLPGLVRRAVRASKPLVRSSVRLCGNPESLCGRPGDLCARPRTCARVRAFCAAVRPLVRAEAHLCAPQTTCAKFGTEIQARLPCVPPFLKGVTLDARTELRLLRVEIVTHEWVPILSKHSETVTMSLNGSGPLRTAARHIQAGGQALRARAKSQQAREYRNT